ncbi:MAG: hypothetical protein QM536_03080 [Chitinophagaceae bacterium]|nr:hypothetical protein [Chitinophagaceae bacterium]
MSLKLYRDYYNTIEYAVNQGKIEIIIRFLKRGKFTLTEIAEDFDVS